MPVARPLNTHGYPIILIGLMGCGKTTLGKELSKITGLPLLDMDAVIEEQIGKSIPDIFRDHGEAHFRSLETALLRYLTERRAFSHTPPIISTGGGVVVRAENRELLRRLGFVVWLNAGTKDILQRTARATNRPLLKVKNRRAVIERLQQERNPLYAAAAHMRMDTSQVDIPELVERIRQSAEAYFAAFPQ